MTRVHAEAGKNISAAVALEIASLIPNENKFSLVPR